MLSCKCCFCKQLFEDVGERQFFDHWESCALGILSIDVFDFYYLSKCFYDFAGTRCPHFVMDHLKTEGYIEHHQWHAASIRNDSSYILVYKCDQCKSTFSRKQYFLNHLRKTNTLNRCSKYQKEKTPYHSVVKFDLNSHKLKVIGCDTDIVSLNTSVDAIRLLAYSVTKVTDQGGKRVIEYSCKKCVFHTMSKTAIMSHLRNSHLINYGNKKSKFGNHDANGNSKNKGKRKREKLINQSTHNANFHGTDEPPQKKRKKLARKNNNSDEKNEKSDLSMKSQLVLSMTTSAVVPPSLTNNVKHKREKSDSIGSIVNEALFVKKRKTTDATLTSEDSKIDLMENEDESSMTVIGRSGRGSIHSMIINQKRKARQKIERNDSVLRTMSTFGNYDASDATGLSTNLNNNNNNNHNNNSSHTNSNRSSQSNISESGQGKMKKSQSNLRRYTLTRAKTDNMHKKKWEDDDSDDENTNDEFESNNMKELPKERMNISRHHSVDNTNVNRNTNASTNTSNVGKRKRRSFNREEKKRIDDNGDINTSHQFGESQVMKSTLSMRRNGMTIGNDLAPRSQSKSQSKRLNNNTISNYFSNMKSFNRKEKRRMCDNGNIDASNESGLSLQDASPQSQSQSQSQSQGARLAQAMKSAMKSPMRQHSESEGPSIDNDLTLQSQSKSQSNDFRNNIDNNNNNNNSTNNNDGNDTNGKMTTSKTFGNWKENDDEDDTEYEDTILPLTHTTSLKRNYNNNHNSNHGRNHRGLYTQRVLSQSPQLSDTGSEKERHPLKLRTPSLLKNNQSSLQSHVTDGDNETNTNSNNANASLNDTPLTATPLNMTCITSQVCNGTTVTPINLSNDKKLNLNNQMNSNSNIKLDNVNETSNGNDTPTRIESINGVVIGKNRMIRPIATQLSKLKIHRKNRVSTPQHGSRQSPMTNTTDGTSISSRGYKVGPNLPTPTVHVETPLSTVSGRSKTSNNNAHTPTLGARIGRSILSYIHGNKQNDSNNNNNNNSLKNENNDNKTDSKIENGNHLNQSDHTASTGGTTVTGTTLNNATLIVYDDDSKDLQSRQSTNNSIKTKISKKVESSGNDINISMISSSKHSMVDDMGVETDDEMNETMDVILPPAKMQSYEPPIGNDNARNYGLRHNNNDNGKNNISSSTEHIFCKHNSGGSNRIEATQRIDKSLKIGNNNNRKKCGLTPATIAVTETTTLNTSSDGTPNVVTNDDNSVNYSNDTNNNKIGLNAKSGKLFDGGVSNTMYNTMTDNNNSNVTNVETRRGKTREKERRPWTGNETSINLKNKIQSDSNIKLDSVNEARIGNMNGVVIDKNKMMPQHDTRAGNGGCQVGPDLPISNSIIDSEYSAILSNFDESRNDSLDLTSINNDENAWGPEREEEDDEEQDVDVENGENGENGGNGGERKITMQDSRMKIAGSGNTGWNIGTSQDCMGICFAGNCNMQGGSRYMPKGRVGKKQKSKKKQLNDMSNIISFNNNNDNNSNNNNNDKNNNNFGNGKCPIGINGEQLKQLWKQLKDEMKKDQGSNCGETPSINITVYNYMDMANANLSNGAGIAMNCDGNINNEQRVKMGNIMSHNNRYEMGENSSNVKIDDHSVKISGKGAAAYTMSTKQDVMSGVNQFGNSRQHSQTVNSNWSEFE